MDNYNFSQNPIDIVEEIIYSKKWNFSRAAEHELVAEISSHNCQYRFYFSWSEQIKAISLTVTFDIKFSDLKLPQIYELLSRINEKLWIGHFDITSKSGIPAFRHTVLESQENEILHNQLADLVDIAVYECEKYYPAFQLISLEDKLPTEALKFCEIEVIGSA